MHSQTSGRKRFPIYAVMLYVGLVVAFAAGDRLARAAGLDPVRVVLAFLISIPACLAGARGLDVLVNWAHYRARPREILSVTSGGAAMYGALPPAFLLSIPLLAWLEIPFGTFWDVAVLAILAGMLPTRFGCLGSGCCAGRPTASRLGLNLCNAAGVRARRFPSQLFEALLGALLLAVALPLFGRLPFPGAVALLVIAGYGLGRMVLERLREEHVPRAAGLSAYQWMSLFLFVFGAVGLAAGWTGDSGPSPTPLAAAPGAPGAMHVIASGLALIPIVYLFRFLGCSILFAPGDPTVVTHPLQMIAIFPDIGSGEASVRISFLLEPELAEIDESPVDLVSAGTLGDGRLQFEVLAELPQGAYLATCTISRTGALSRTGSCSGELNGPGLVLAFNAENGSAPTSLEPRLCFQPSP